MSITESITKQFSRALNERTAFLVGNSTRYSTMAEECKGFTNIKIDDEQVYYHWQIFPESQQNVFSSSSIPKDEDAFSFTLNRVINEIENFQVMGNKPYQVLQWTWQLPNLDKERAGQLIEQLELVRQRVRMYLTEPNEIDSFLIGWAVAAKSGYNFSCDENILREILQDLGVTYTLRGNEPSKFTWDFVDKRLKAEIRAWQQTYDLVFNI